MGCGRLGLAVSLALVGTGGIAAVADEGIHPICPLALHQERAELEERRLDVDLATSRLTAADSIFALVNELWESDAVERMIYLNAKHDRDVAQIESKRQQLLLKRQEAVVARYEFVCSAPDPGESASARQRRIDEARRRYLQVDCHSIGKQLAIAEVDLAFRNEVLASVRDLRENDVATAQDVIRAERDVDLARKRVEHHGRRARECTDSGAAGRTR